jgi:hypothetical protein
MYIKLYLDISVLELHEGNNKTCKVVEKLFVVNFKCNTHSGRLVGCLTHVQGQNSAIAHAAKPEEEVVSRPVTTGADICQLIIYSNDPCGSATNCWSFVCSHLTYVNVFICTYLPHWFVV